MYIRRFRRQRCGKDHSYWGLVESCRTERGPRQRLVTYLGKEDEAGGLGVKVALDGSSGWWQPALEGFEGPRPRWVEVDWSRIHLERSKEFGGAWLGLEVARRLGLPELLDELVERGREDVPWSSMALVLVLARLLDPSSELRLAETIYDRTAMSDLLDTQGDTTVRVLAWEQPLSDASPTFRTELETLRAKRSGSVAVAAPVAIGPSQERPPSGSWVFMPGRAFHFSLPLYEVWMASAPVTFEPYEDAGNLYNEHFGRWWNGEAPGYQTLHVQRRNSSRHA